MRRALFVSALLFSCGGGAIREIAPPPAPFESYTAALERTGLAKKAIGAAWLGAGKTALEQPRPTQLPHRALMYFDPAEPAARGFRLALSQGQRLNVSVNGAPDAAIFVDLFAQLPGIDGGTATLMRVAAEEHGTLSYEVRRSDTYVLRVQPELLIGGRLDINIEAAASLHFPVSGKDSTAIKSLFGAPRDGGRRSHEGVDIFAPHGTPVLAATDGYVVSVRDDRLGGRVIWQRDRARGLGFYYAHLDERYVTAGTWVKAGEAIGSVGNTGNAIRTPPHLHFGVYRSRAVDPFPFLHRTPPAAPPKIDLQAVGDWSRVSQKAANVRAAPSVAGEVLVVLKQHSAVRVIGGNDKWVEAELSDGRVGYILGSLIEPAKTPLSSLEIQPGTELFRAPRLIAATGTTAAVKAKLLASAGDALYVEMMRGRTAWIRAGDVAMGSPNDRDKAYSPAKQGGRRRNRGRQA